MKTGFKNIFKSDSTTNVHSLFLIWKKVHHILFFIILVGFIFWGWRIWSQSLQGWSQQKKDDYANAQNKSIEFKESAFNKTLQALQARKVENSQDYNALKNIFQSYN